MTTHTIVVSPDAWQAMPWPARTRLLNRILRAERVTAGPPPMEATLAWAQSVRDEARALQAVMPVDPDAGVHRAGVA